jgi:hypothetical protein
MYRDKALFLLCGPESGSCTLDIRVAARDVILINIDIFYVACYA